MVKKRIGEILVDSGAVSESVIEMALSRKDRGQKLGDYLVTQGLVKEETLYENLRNQLQISLFRMDDVVLSPEVLNVGEHNLLLDCVAFPVEISGSLLTVAMADPLDTNSVERLERELGYEILPALGLKSEILNFIDIYFAMNDTMESVFNVTGVSLNDKSEAQILDHISGLVVGNGKLHFVLSEYKGRVTTVYGDCGLGSSRELKLLIKVLCQVAGVTLGKSESAIYTSSEGNRVRVTVDHVSRGEYVEYWITMSEVVETRDGDRKLKFDNMSAGLCLIELSDFGKVDDVLFEIVSEYGNGNVLSYGGRDSLLDFGIRYVDRSLIPYESVVDIADIFLVEDIWSEQGRIEALKLVMAGKLVISIVPNSMTYEFEDMFVGKSPVDRALYSSLKSFLVYE